MVVVCNVDGLLVKCVDDWVVFDRVLALVAWFGSDRNLDELRATVYIWYSRLFIVSGCVVLLTYGGMGSVKCVPLLFVRPTKQWFKGRYI